MRRANVAMAKSDRRYVDSQLCQTYGAPEVGILVSHSPPFHPVVYSLTQALRTGQYL